MKRIIKAKLDVMNTATSSAFKGNALTPRSVSNTKMTYGDVRFAADGRGQIPGAPEDTIFITKKGAKSIIFVRMHYIISAILRHCF